MNAYAHKIARARKVTGAYKITGILAALSLTAAFGALAQSTTPTEVQNSVTNPPATPAPPVPVLPSTVPQAPVPDPQSTDATPPLPATEAAPSTPVAAAPEAKTFIRQAFLANEFGIAASQVALTKAKSPDTKAAAQAILDDGAKVRQDMVTAIQGSTSDMHFDQTWSPEYKAKLAELKAAKSTDFDQKYIALQGDINEQTTNLFSTYASTGTDATVKTFATNTLPTLQAAGDKLDAAAQGGN